MIDLVRERTVIAAPLPRVLSLIVDVANWPDWQPSLEQVELLDGQSPPQTARLGSRVGPWLAFNTVSISHSADGLSFTLRNSELLRTYDGIWSAREVGANHTEVGYALRVVPVALAPKFIVERATRSDLNASLNSMKESLAHWERKGS